MISKNALSVILLMFAGLLLAACGAQVAAVETEHDAPSHVTAIEGSEVSRVELSESAAKRLDIQTAPLTEEPVVRKRVVGGEVVLPTEVSAVAGVSPRGGAAWVRVNLSGPDISKIDMSRPGAVTVPGGKAGMQAKLVEGPSGIKDGAAAGALYYEVSAAEHGLVAGQRVQIEVTLAGDRGLRKIVPYSAVVYDLHGDTWVYTNPGSLSYVREPITVDYIEGDRAILTDGPQAGTVVVTVGAAELIGTELGVGH